MKTTEELLDILRKERAFNKAGEEALALLKHACDVADADPRIRLTITVDMEKAREVLRRARML